MICDGGGFWSGRERRDGADLGRSRSCGRGPLDERRIGPEREMPRRQRARCPEREEPLPTREHEMMKPWR